MTAIDDIRSRMTGLNSKLDALDADVKALVTKVGTLPEGALDSGSVASVVADLDALSVKIDAVRVDAVA